MQIWYIAFYCGTDSYNLHPKSDIEYNGVCVKRNGNNFDFGHYNLYLYGTTYVAAIRFLIRGKES